MAVIMPDYVSVREAAQMLNYHPESVRDLIRAGKLRADKKGLSWWVYRESVEQFKQENAGRQKRGRPRQL